ncbi:MAG: chemotaxis protein methyltransferase [Herpetosiphonaceae bacterium]|nr:MAG: chemotaxis protein methyltransferase [Herpetosiphonaceae bacterium]
MQYPSEHVPISDGTFTLLRNLIHERIGLYYDMSRRDVLMDRLSPRIIELGLGSSLDYYYLLKYSDTESQEWSYVVDVLSVPETYFWREMDQVQALVEYLVPKLVAAKPDSPLRIWSAACATGEEPLTIAMALNEAGWFDRTAIEINASDASPRAIAKARQGLYRERSFRSLPRTLWDRYFVERNGVWQISPEIHSRVRWAVANLMAPHEIAGFANAPIIFCRNVFLYFSQEAMSIVVHHFYHCMPAPGFLFLGAAESLLRINTPFELQEIGQSFVYVKR